MIQGSLTSSRRYRVPIHSQMQAMKCVITNIEKMKNVKKRLERFLEENRLGYFGKCSSGSKITVTKKTICKRRNSSVSIECNVQIVGTVAIKSTSN